MTKLQPGDYAPDFTLLDHQETAHTLSDITSKHNVLLVFNLGFV